MSEPMSPSEIDALLASSSWEDDGDSGRSVWIEDAIITMRTRVVDPGRVFVHTRSAVVDNPLTEASLSRVIAYLEAAHDAEYALLPQL